MKDPVTGEMMTLFTRKETLNYRGEEFEVVSSYFSSRRDAQGYSTDELDELTLSQVHNQYRAKHRIPYPDEMKQMREQFGVSANKMAEILGLSVNAYRQYEAGEVPSVSNARLIGMARNPELFLQLVEQSGELSEKEKDKIRVRIADSNVENGEWAIGGDHLMGPRGASKFTGNREPNPEKAMELIGLVAGRTRAGKVKMNKLMFYIDFAHYRKYGCSVTGARYRAIQKGPVLSHYDGLFARAEEKGIVSIEIKSIQEEAIIHQFAAKLPEDYKPRYLSAEELETVNEVLKRLGKKKASELSELSHVETAWIDNNANHGLINYDYAFEMKEI